MNKLLCMLDLQQQLNDSTNGKGWEAGVTKDGKPINWRRCIYMESAEMIDSFPWKHWKSIAQPTDYANLQIEIVDVWHFILSLVLESESARRSGRGMQAVAEEMLCSPWYDSLLGTQGGKFAEDRALMAKIEAMMRHALEPEVPNDLGMVVDDFFALAYMGGLNLDQLYRLYVGKNILNRFRQDHGYKEGTYIKIWNGEEDNAVMKSAWEKNPDMSPDELYNTLKKGYPA